MNKSEIFFGLLRIPIDFLMALSAFYAAYYARFYDILGTIFRKPDLEIFPPMTEYIVFSEFESIALLIILALMGMYSLKTTDSIPREMKKIIFGTSIWFMAIVTYYFVIRSFPFSRLVLGYSFVLGMLFLMAGRIAIRGVQTFALNRGIGKRKVVFLGGNTVAKQLAEHFEMTGRYEVVANVSSFSSLPACVERYGAEEIIQTKEVQHVQATDILDFCREHHLRYHFVPSILEVQRTNVTTRSFEGIPLISLNPTPLDGWGKVVKRVFDIAGAGLGLVLLSPVFAIIALAIKLDSTGPVFFRYLDDGKKAKRVGQFGQRFHCLKFRTMRQRTHMLRYSDELAAHNTRKGTPLVKIKNDPRVTRVGKILRKYSLDELPQLWNVLAGEMSLVGPRPHLPEEVEQYERHHKFALAIKPGITGLAQVSGRSDLDFETEVRLDTYYVENWNLWIDIKILLKTILVVLRGHEE